MSVRLAARILPTGLFLFPAVSLPDVAQAPYSSPCHPRPSPLRTGTRFRTCHSHRTAFAQRLGMPRAFDYLSPTPTMSCPWPQSIRRRSAGRPSVPTANPWPIPLGTTPFACGTLPQHLINNNCNNATSGRCQMQRSGHKGIDFASVAGGVVVEVVDKGFRNVLRQPHHHPRLHGSHHRCQPRTRQRVLHLNRGKHPGSASVAKGGAAGTTVDTGSTP